MTLTEIGRALYGSEYWHKPFAEGLGISKQWLWRLCREDYAPSDDIRQRLAALIEQRQNELKNISLSAK